MNPDENGPDDGTEDQPVLLIVDDEQGLLDLHVHWLGDRYAVRTALDGEEALRKFDEDVDVVLLDRRMPGRTGDKVLEEIRAEDADCRVAMVTAVNPDFDIVEMGLDDYVTKPVSADDLRATVEGLVRLSAYDDQVQRYYSLASKKAVLEAEKSVGELSDNDEYRRLEEELERARHQVDDTLHGGDENDFDVLYQDFNTSG